VVIVTGSGSGIGRAVARRFLERGETVVGFDVAEDQVSPSGSGRWIPVQVDVADPASVEKAVRRARDAEGACTTLVVSAAVGFPDAFEQIDEAAWDRILGVYLRGTFSCVQTVLPDMIEAGSGTVVVVSSIAGRRMSVTNGAHYTCSKYAQIGLVRHLAQELAGTGVRINCVCPGPTDTPALDRNSTPEEKQSIIARTPLRRLAEPTDVADAVLFLADERSRHIHGAVLDVNGGLY
jgi:2-hydroxycyclohexanecarboxyl-CoA dehydrogenase